MTRHLLFAAAFLWTAPVHAESVATHAMVVAGQASAPPGAGIFACGTGGPQPREAKFFGTGIPLPSEGYAYCLLSGAIDDAASPIGNSLVADRRLQGDPRRHATLRGGARFTG